ncbi:polycomb protein Asx isoform X2 [Condylostylus longicornis]|nr:polycomb protein Asx isoform X2 [Condylostylus longicornis]
MECDVTPGSSIASASEKHATEISSQQKLTPHKQHNTLMTTVKTLASVAGSSDSTNNKLSSSGSDKLIITTSTTTSASIAVQQNSVLSSQRLHTAVQRLPSTTSFHHHHHHRIHHHPPVSAQSSSHPQIQIIHQINNQTNVKPFQIQQQQQIQQQRSIFPNVNSPLQQKIQLTTTPIFIPKQIPPKVSKIKIQQQMQHQKIIASTTPSAAAIEEPSIITATTANSTTNANLSINSKSTLNVKTRKASTPPPILQSKISQNRQSQILQPKIQIQQVRATLESLTTEHAIVEESDPLAIDNTTVLPDENSSTSSTTIGQQDGNRRTHSHSLRRNPRIIFKPIPEKSLVTAVTTVTTTTTKPEKGVRSSLRNSTIASSANSVSFATSLVATSQGAIGTGSTQTISSASTMREVIAAAIPGYNMKSRPRRSNKNKLSTAAQIEQTKDGRIDLETPDSILCGTNLRALLNKHTFSLLPPLYQYNLVQLLPACDRPSNLEPLKLKNLDNPMDTTIPAIHLNASALNNEFFARACLEWRERLTEGEFTPENQVKLKSEAEREKLRLDPWKLKHFEPIWGDKRLKSSQVNTSVSNTPTATCTTSTTTVVQSVYAETSPPLANVTSSQPDVNSASENNIATITSLIYSSGTNSSSSTNSNYNDNISSNSNNISQPATNKSLKISVVNSSKSNNSSLTILDMPTTSSYKKVQLVVANNESCKNTDTSGNHHLPEKTTIMPQGTKTPTSITSTTENTTEIKANDRKSANIFSNSASDSLKNSCSNTNDGINSSNSSINEKNNGKQLLSNETPILRPALKTTIKLNKSITSISSTNCGSTIASVISSTVQQQQPKQCINNSSNTVPSPSSSTSSASSTASTSSAASSASSSPTSTNSPYSDTAVSGKSIDSTDSHNINSNSSSTTSIVTHNSSNKTVSTNSILTSKHENISVKSVIHTSSALQVSSSQNILKGSEVCSPLELSNNNVLQEDRRQNIKLEHDNETSNSNDYLSECSSSNDNNNKKNYCVEMCNSSFNDNLNESHLPNQIVDKNCKQATTLAPEKCDKALIEINQRKSFTNPLLKTNSSKILLKNGDIVSCSISENENLERRQKENLIGPVKVEEVDLPTEGNFQHYHQSHFEIENLKSRTLKRSSSSPQFGRSENKILKLEESKVENKEFMLESHSKIKLSIVKNEVKFSSSEPFSTDLVEDKNNKSTTYSDQFQEHELSMNEVKEGLLLDQVEQRQLQQLNEENVMQFQEQNSDFTNIMDSCDIGGATTASISTVATSGNLQDDSCSNNDILSEKTCNSLEINNKLELSNDLYDNSNQHGINVGLASEECIEHDVDSNEGRPETDADVLNENDVGSSDYQLSESANTENGFNYESNANPVPMVSIQQAKRPLPSTDICQSSNFNFQHGTFTFQNQTINEMDAEQSHLQKKIQIEEAKIGSYHHHLDQDLYNSTIDEEENHLQVKENQDHQDILDDLIVSEDLANSNCTLDRNSAIGTLLTCSEDTNSSTSALIDCSAAIIGNGSGASSGGSNSNNITNSPSDVDTINEIEPSLQPICIDDDHIVQKIADGENYLIENDHIISGNCVIPSTSSSVILTEIQAGKNEVQTSIPISSSSSSIITSSSPVIVLQSQTENYLSTQEHHPQLLEVREQQQQQHSQQLQQSRQQPSQQPTKQNLLSSEEIYKHLKHDWNFGIKVESNQSVMMDSTSSSDFNISDTGIIQKSITVNNNDNQNVLHDSEQQLQHVEESHQFQRIEQPLQQRLQLHQKQQPNINKDNLQIKSIEISDGAISASSNNIKLNLDKENVEYQYQQQDQNQQLVNDQQNEQPLIGGNNSQIKTEMDIPMTVAEMEVSSTVASNNSVNSNDSFSNQSISDVLNNATQTQNLPQQSTTKLIITTTGTSQNQNIPAGTIITTSADGSFIIQTSSQNTSSMQQQQQNQLQQQIQHHMQQNLLRQQNMLGLQNAGVSQQLQQQQPVQTNQQTPQQIVLKNINPGAVTHFSTTSAQQPQQLQLKIQSPQAIFQQTQHQQPHQKPSQQIHLQSVTQSQLPTTNIQLSSPQQYQVQQVHQQNIAGKLIATNQKLQFSRAGNAATNFLAVNNSVPSSGTVTVPSQTIKVIPNSGGISSAITPQRSKLLTTQQQQHQQITQVHSQPSNKGRRSSNKLPPGAVNLERSYQICQAVIQNSPNRHQLTAQLRRPPPSLLTSSNNSANITGSIASNNTITIQKKTDEQVITPGRTVYKVIGPRLGFPRKKFVPRQASPTLIRHVYTTAGTGIPNGANQNIQLQQPGAQQTIIQGTDQLQHGSGHYVLIHRANVGAADNQAPRASSAPPAQNQQIHGVNGVPISGRGRPASVDVDTANTVQEIQNVGGQNAGAQSVTRRIVNSQGGMYSDISLDQNNSQTATYIVNTSSVNSNPIIVSNNNNNNSLNASVAVTSVASVASATVLSNTVVTAALNNTNSNNNLINNNSSCHNSSNNGDNTTSQNNYSCSCSLNAMVICQQCGAFCHDDCISTSKLCVSCVIR